MNENAVKWIVVGVIALVAIFVFKGQLGNLISRTSEVNVSKEGVKVVATPIGVTTVSAQRLSERLGIGTEQSEPNVYIDEQHKFLISWPLNSEWTPSNKMSQAQFEAAGIRDRSRMPTFLVAKWETPLSPHVGMVSVDVYPSETYGRNIQALVNEIYKSMNLNGITLDSSSIDQDTGGAVLVTHDTSGLSAVNRLLVGDTWAYNIFSLSYPPSNDYAELRSETNTILNSIRILQ